MASESFIPTVVQDPDFGLVFLDFVGRVMVGSGSMDESAVFGPEGAHACPYGFDQARQEGGYVHG